MSLLVLLLLLPIVGFALGMLLNLTLVIKKTKFKPEDFYDCWARSKALTAQEVAKRANEILKGEE